MARTTHSTAPAPDVQNMNTTDRVRYMESIANLLTAATPVTSPRGSRPVPGRLNRRQPTTTDSATGSSPPSRRTRSKTKRVVAATNTEQYVAPDTEAPASARKATPERETPTAKKRKLNNTGAMIKAHDPIRGYVEKPKATSTPPEVTPPHIDAATATAETLHTPCRSSTTEQTVSDAVATIPTDPDMASTPLGTTPEKSPHTVETAPDTIVTSDSQTTYELPASVQMTQETVTSVPASSITNCADRPVHDSASEKSDEKPKASSVPMSRPLRQRHDGCKARHTGRNPTTSTRFKHTNNKISKSHSRQSASPVNKEHSEEESAEVTPSGPMRRTRATRAGGTIRSPLISESFKKCPERYLDRLEPRRIEEHSDGMRALLKDRPASRNRVVDDPDSWFTPELLQQSFYASNAQISFEQVTSDDDGKDEVDFITQDGNLPIDDEPAEGEAKYIDTDSADGASDTDEGMSDEDISDQHVDEHVEPPTTPQHVSENIESLTPTQSYFGMFPSPFRWLIRRASQSVSRSGTPHQSPASLTAGSPRQAGPMRQTRISKAHNPPPKAESRQKHRYQANACRVVDLQNKLAQSNRTIRQQTEKITLLAEGSEEQQVKLATSQKTIEELRATIAALQGERDDALAKQVALEKHDRPDPTAVSANAKGKRRRGSSGAPDSEDEGASQDDRPSKKKRVHFNDDPVSNLIPPTAHERRFQREKGHEDPIINHRNTMQSFQKRSFPPKSRPRHYTRLSTPSPSSSSSSRSNSVGDGLGDPGHQLSSKRLELAQAVASPHVKKLGPINWEAICRQLSHRCIDDSGLPPQELSERQVKRILDLATLKNDAEDALAKQNAGDIISDKEREAIASGMRRFGHLRGSSTYGAPESDSDPSDDDLECSESAGDKTPPASRTAKLPSTPPYSMAPVFATPATEEPALINSQATNDSPNQTSIQDTVMDMKPPLNPSPAQPQSHQTNHVAHDGAVPMTPNGTANACENPHLIRQRQLADKYKPKTASRLHEVSAASSCQSSPESSAKSGSSTEETTTAPANSNAADSNAADSNPLQHSPNPLGQFGTQLLEMLYETPDIHHAVHWTTHTKAGRDCLNYYKNLPPPSMEETAMKIGAGGLSTLLSMVIGV